MLSQIVRGRVFMMTNGPGEPYYVREGSLLGEQLLESRHRWLVGAATSWLAWQLSY